MEGMMAGMFILALAYKRYPSHWSAGSGHSGGNGGYNASSWEELVEKLMFTDIPLFLFCLAWVWTTY
jgi:hypothetical protein